MIDWIESFRSALGGYNGTKVAMADWIAGELLRYYRGGLVLDVCSGLGSMSYRFKLANIRVVSGDSQLYPYYACYSVIENSDTRLSADGVEWLCRANQGNFDDFATKTFKGRYLPNFLLRAIDRVRYNIRVAESEGSLQGAARAIALAALGRATQSVKHHSIFSTATPSARVRSEDEFLDLYRKIVANINALVFKAQPCRVYWCDGPGLIASTAKWKTPVDVLYIDPPYVTKRSHPSYWSHYWFIEGLLDDWHEMRDGMRDKDFRNLHDLTNAKEIRSFLVDIVRASKHIPVIAISYDKEGDPPVAEIAELLDDNGWDATILSREHVRRGIECREAVILGISEVRKHETKPREEDIVNGLREQAVQALTTESLSEDDRRHLTNALNLADSGDTEPLVEAVFNLGKERT